MVYDAGRDAFLPPPSGYSSWTLNETTCQYEAPQTLPADAGVQADGTQNFYTWDESTTSWKKTVVNLK